jgi:HEAT repeat protein
MIAHWSLAATLLVACGNTFDPQVGGDGPRGIVPAEIVRSMQDFLRQQQAAVEFADPPAPVPGRKKPETQRSLLVSAYAVDEDTLRADLKSKDSRKRFAAAYVIGERQLPWHGELIAQLSDPNDYVRQAARRSLVILSFLELQKQSAGILSDDEKYARRVALVDFGPRAGAHPTAQQQAAKKWEEWWGGRREATATKQPAVRSARAEAQLDAEAARLSAALVFAEPTRQAEVLARYREAKGIAYTEAMANALAQLDGESLTKGRQYLAERLARMNADTLRDRLSDPRAELRLAAALAFATKDYHTAVPALIPVLADPEEMVVRGAKTALKNLTKQDFGPARGASAAQRAEAVAAWKAWWRKQG